MTPLRSPDRNLFSAPAAYTEITAHSRPMGTLGTTSSASVSSYTERRTPLPSTGGSTVSSTTTHQQHDAVTDSVQSCLDRLQARFDTKIDMLTNILESNLQIGSNNRFGLMSARLVDFQATIDQKLEDHFTNFRVDLLDVRTTLREELHSFWVHSNFSSGPIPSTNFQSRSTPDRPNTDEFKGFNSYFPDTFLPHHSRPSSPISVLSHESASSC